MARRNELSLAHVPPGSILQLVLPKSNVFSKANLQSEIICFLLMDNIIEVLESTTQENGFLWVKCLAGWIVANDGRETNMVNVIKDIDIANKFWKEEESKRNRMASAIASMLVRSYSLPRAKRLARSINKHAIEHYPQTPLLKITNQGMEDIMIALGGQIGLTKAQVFEYIKAAAGRQSNPRQAVLQIAQEVFDLLFTRPSIWVTEHKNVIQTEDKRIDVNRFIMSAAEGDLELFKSFLRSKAELTSLHSELHYSVLHAAADFGQIEILKYIFETGLSLDIRDPHRGQTALHYAAFSGREEVVELLLQAGANRELLCHKGMYPYQYSLQQGHLDCAELLKFLPPTIQHIEITDVTLNSIALIWKAPHLHRHHAMIQEYCIHCMVLDTNTTTKDPPLIYTSVLHAKFRDLETCCSYRIRVKCRTASGWSVYSEWVYCKTLAHIPSEPLPVEIRKITPNSLYIMWFPPLRDNGHPIDLYELELLDHQTLCLQEENSEKTILKNIQFNVNFEEDQQSIQPSSSYSLVEGSMESSDILDNESVNSSTTKKSRGSRRTSASSALRKSFHALSVNQDENTPLKASSVSKMHRYLKHKNAKELSKYFTGLEPNRAYRIKVRAHNKMGFSSWSQWCPCIAPNYGVWVKEFYANELSAVMEWFVPKLNETREIECYELQLCRIQGPMIVTRFVKEFVPEDHHNNNNYDENSVVPISRPQEDLNEFITLSSTIQNNYYKIDHLRPGGRYQVRVRAKVKNENWLDWDISVKSEPFATPPGPPEPPVNVKPFEEKILSSKTQYEFEHDQHHEHHQEGDHHHHKLHEENLPHPPINEEDCYSEDHSQLTLIDSQGSNFIPPENKLQAQDGLSITHNTIVITWTNGDSNGENIEDYLIEMACVRAYNHLDVIHAKEAFLGLSTNEEDDDTQFNNYYHPLNENLSSSREFLSQYNHELHWTDITSKESYLAPQIYQVKGLLPGHAYTFRLKQRNRCGWSEYSKASPLISTYPSAPPNPPCLLYANTNYMIIYWQETTPNNALEKLTTLEYQLQYRTLASNSLTDASKGSSYMTFIHDWRAIEGKTLSKTQLAIKFKQYPISGLDITNEEMLQAYVATQIEHLIEQSWMIFRVRVRTVVGLSPWSEPSLPCRTLR